MINLDNEKDTLVKESENDELIVSLDYVKAAPLKVFVQDKLVAVNNFVENDLDDTIEDEINEVAVQLVKSLFLPLGAPSVSNVTPVESFSSSNESLATFRTITTKTCVHKFFGGQKEANKCISAKAAAEMSLAISIKSKIE